MTFDFLAFLTSPVFVIPWFGFGLVAAVFVLFDVSVANRHVNEALKIGWPIVIIFFSIAGLLLYLWTCRPPGIIHKQGSEAQSLH